MTNTLKVLQLKPSKLVKFYFKFSEKNMFENLARDAMIAVTQFIGWIVLDVAIYQGKSLFNRKRKKRQMSNVDDVTGNDVPVLGSKKCRNLLKV